MKNYLGTLILLLSFTCLLSGQTSDHFEHKNAIKISPFEFGNAEFQLAYERYFGERTSSLVISPSVILKENAQESISGYQLAGQYRFYLSHLKNGINGFLGLHNIGFYGGVYGLYMDYNEDYVQFRFDPLTQTEIQYDLTKTAQSFEGGAVVGMQVDITKRILFDFYVGGGIRKSDVEDTMDDIMDQPVYTEYYGVFDREYTGVKPEIGFQLGITF